MSAAFNIFELVFVFEPWAQIIILLNVLIILFLLRVAGTSIPSSRRERGYYTDLSIWCEK